MLNPPTVMLNLFQHLIRTIAEISSSGAGFFVISASAEGGALTWRPIPGIDDEWIYKQFQLLSLHGQNKDALAKTKLGAWEYDRRPKTRRITTSM